MEAVIGLVVEGAGGVERLIELGPGRARLSAGRAGVCPGSAGCGRICCAQAACERERERERGAGRGARVMGAGMPRADRAPP